MSNFIFFKKYYQRVCFKTDIEYLKAVSNIYWNKKHEHEVVLKVIGHSLDVTDKEIIKDLFETANKIKIFYHSFISNFYEYVKFTIHLRFILHLFRM